MKLTALGSAPDTLFAVFYDPARIGSEEQVTCRETNMCRLLGFGSCPAKFLWTEQVVSLAIEEVGDGETRVVTLIGSLAGLQVAEYMAHFVGTYYKRDIGRELCDAVIAQYGGQQDGSIDYRSGSQASRGCYQGDQASRGGRGGGECGATAACADG